MPCDTRPNLTEQAKQQQQAALERLQRQLGAGAVKVTVSRQGAVAFTGWAESDREGLSDLCAFRRLTSAGSSELRMALARAEAAAGVKLDRRAIAAGVHSHDGGKSWHGGHS